MDLTAKLSAIARESITWAFAGALYGGFFAGLLAYLNILQDSHWFAMIFASAASGLVIAAFFGSMLVALGGTATGILTAISYYMLFSTHDQPLILISITFVFGLLAGSIFTRREIKQAQPLAQASSGLLAGLAAGLVLAALTVSIHPADGFWATSTISVILVGMGYVFLIGHVPGFMRNALSLTIGGPLVCGVIAVAVATTFWLIGASYMSIGELVTTQNSLYQSVLENTPVGLLGGAIGGAFGGTMLELIGIELEEHIN